MKTKYFALGLVAIALASSGLTWSLTRSEQAPGRVFSAEARTLQALADQLQLRLEDIQALNRLLGQQEERGLSLAPLPAKPELLVGAEVPVEKKTRRSPAARPWWHGYSLSMVLVSNGASSAVINGRYVRAGDTIGNGVVVRTVEQNQVVLERRGARATLSIKTK